MEKFKKKREMIKIIGAVLVLILFVSFSYAMFTSTIDNSKQTTSTLNTGTMSIIFKDNNPGINEKLNLGDTVIKKFIIENTGTLPASLSIQWKNMINTYEYESLSYKLLYSETEEGPYQEELPKTNIPTTGERITQDLISELSVPAGKKYYYDLEITFNDLEKNQDADKEAIFNTEFDINTATRYKQYILRIDPNGGVWEEYTNAQEYLMLHNDTKIIENPTRIGYIFDGWAMDGSTSILEGKEFKMGIFNTTLKAKWKPKKITIEIETDGETREVETEYGERIDLGIPEKEGHTFTGWSTNKGTIEGNTLIIDTEDTDIKVTANYTPNNYKYIVYHKKQNTDGVNYTLVEADTENKEGIYGTTVTPGVKTYTGFTSPSQRSLTIQVDTDPPTKNILNYEYGRNRYTLTINPNGGTYTGNTNEEMYYEETKDLGVATKIGYNFTNWTVTDGTMTGNNYQMGLENATATANYTPKEYSVTFNANGGTVSTLSKTVTYNSTYGDLPTPSYPGYVFTGWYTASSGGTEITSSTKVSLTDNQILFAHWEVISSSAILKKLGLKTKTGNPDFSKVATTDETADGLYSMQDDYGTSYYFRGAANNNYVKFGKNKDGEDMWWRIIRINGDGSLRIIYDGTQGWANGAADNNRLAIINQVWNKKLLNNDAKYVSWMFGGAQGEASTSYEEATRNETNSDIKTAVDNWYVENIKNTGYSKYLSNELFCNDRTAYTDRAGTTLGNGYGALTTYYGAYTRLANTTKKPSLKCPQKNDMFTLKNGISPEVIRGVVEGNKALDFPVGLITADEASIAGGVYNTSNTNYYLYKSSNNCTWSLSSHFVDKWYARVIHIDNSGRIEYNDTNLDIGAASPVINLSAEYAKTLIGTGTITTPFRLP